MPLLAFNLEQILILSTTALTSPTDNSPIRPYFVIADEITTPATWRETLQEFATEGMIVGDKDGKPRLCRELEILFFALHKPEEVFSLARAEAPDIAESFFCRSGKTWFQVSVNFNETLVVIQYPFDWKAINRWFADEFLGEVEPVADSIKNLDIEVTVPELIVLSAMQTIYVKRAEQSGKVTGDNLKITLDELSAPDVIDAVNKVSMIFVDKEKLTQSMKDRALLGGALQLLAEKGLVEGVAGTTSLSYAGTKLFDPGRILGLVTLKKFTENLHARMLYLYPDGYMMVSEAGDGGELKLSARNGSFPKKDLLGFFVQGLVAPTPDIPRSAILPTPEAEKPAVDPSSEADRVYRELPETAAIPVVKRGDQAVPPQARPPEPAQTAPVQPQQPFPPKQTPEQQAPQQPVQPPKPPQSQPPQQPAQPPQPQTPQPPQPPLQPPEEMSADSTVMYSKPISKVTLLVLEGADVGTELEIRSGNVIGRDASADIVMADPRISRRHVLFGCGLDGVWVIKDLGSSNGTLVNGERVESKALSDGDTIRLGDTTLKFNA